MGANKGYYSLIQYCPDRSRMETANLGVLLFCPELNFLKVMNTSSVKRIKSFFKEQNFNPKALISAVNSVESRLNLIAGKNGGIDEVNDFIGKRANEIILTSLRPVKVREPQETLSRLYAELVQTDRPEKKEKNDTFRKVRNIFNSPDLQGKVRFNLHIPVPLMENKLKIPYAFQNGSLNLVKTEKFPLQKGHAVNKAKNLIIPADLIQKHEDESGLKRRVIVIPNSLETDVLSCLSPLFNEYSIRFILPDELGDFAESVRREAHSFT